VTLKLITFDLDNTLWDVEPALRRAEAAQRAWLQDHRPEAVHTLMSEAGAELRTRLWKQHAHLAHDVTAMRRLFLREMQISAGYTEAEADAGAEAAFAEFIIERQRVELYEGALEVLEELALRYRLGALTNGNADIFRTAAAPYFEFAFRADEIGAAKPSPEMFRAALARAQCAAGETAHVGDNPGHDVLGAAALGIRTVWVNGAGAPWAAGAQRPDAELRELRELPGVLEALAAGPEKETPAPEEAGARMRLP